MKLNISKILLFQHGINIKYIKEKFYTFWGVLSFPNPICYYEAHLSPEQPHSRGQEPERPAPVWNVPW